MTDSGETPPTGLLLREPANPVSPKAVGFWRLSAALGDAVLVIAAILAWVFVPDRPWWTLAILAVVVVASVIHIAFMPRIRYRVHRWEVNDIAVHTRSGWIGRHSRIAPISRVQTVDSTEGAIMRLFGLASLTVTTASASGPISISCLDADVAHDLVAQLTAITAATPGDAT